MIDFIVYSTSILLGTCCTIGYFHKNRIKEHVFIDELTKMYNRKIVPKIKNLEKNGKKYCIVCSDIDHFKRVNDTYGHAAGDSVLKTVASVLIESFKSDKDFVVRFGGEEFFIFVEKSSMCTDVLERRVNEIREKISALEILTENMELIKVTASFGISMAEDLVLDDRVKRADENLYTAKNTGRNKVVLA